MQALISCNAYHVRVNLAIACPTEASHTAASQPQLIVTRLGIELCR